VETFRFRAMNSDILFLAWGNPTRIVDGLKEAQQFIHACEGRFSRFSEHSELSDLNRSAGRPFQASPDLFAVLVLAQRYFYLTRGLFDPSILPDLRRAGYDRSLDLVQQGVAPLFESLIDGGHPSFSGVELDQRRGLVILPLGMEIDLGGIAKGWVAEQAALILSEFTTACAVNAGGDMFLVGLPDGEGQWSVAIEDPLQPERNLTVLEVEPGAVATSSVIKRVWMQGEKPRHHLIDPRTREPALTSWLSVTVIAPHTSDAEVLAKTLLIGGPQASVDLAGTSLGRLSFLAVDQDQRIWSTLDGIDIDSVASQG
jgi:thiamine biosynthesis lipoprotein